MEKLIELILLLITLAVLGTGILGPQIEPQSTPLIAPMAEPMPASDPAHFLILQEYRPAPDVLLVLAWVGTRDQGAWVRACARVERFGEVIERPPYDQATAPNDWPDLMFGFWPADALIDVWFAAGDNGEQKPSCDTIADWPGAQIVTGGVGH